MPRCWAAAGRTGRGAGLEGVSRQVSAGHALEVSADSMEVALWIEVRAEDANLGSLENKCPLSRQIG